MEELWPSIVVNLNTIRPACRERWGSSEQRNVEISLDNVHANQLTWSIEKTMLRRVESERQTQAVGVLGRI